MAQEFRIRGSVRESGTGRPLPGLVVRAYDKDRVYDDLLGNATTDAEGRFELRYSKTDFSELFEAAPDIYFEILDASAGVVIHSTEDAVRWDAGADVEVEINVPGDRIPAVPAAAPPAPRDEKLRVVDPNDRGLEPFVLRLGVDGRELLAAPEQGAVAVEARRDTNPLARRTLGDLGVATTVVGVAAAPLAAGAREDLGGETLVFQPLDRSMLVGIDPTTVRMFRVEEETGALKPVWNSGVNLQLGFAWAKVSRPGTYVPIGLPRDRLLRETLRAVAEERARTDEDGPERTHGLTARHLAALHEADDDELYELRQFLTTLEMQTGVGPFTENDFRLGPGGHILPFPLPREATQGEFRERLKGVETGPGGLPEEALFNPPEVTRHRDFPWPTRPDAGPAEEWLRPEKLERLADLKIGPVRDWVRFLISRDWWMYQHDEHHTGAASGLSNLSSTTVGSLTGLPPVAVDGPIITKPSIVGGKVYIGTGKKVGTGGSTLYKIDLATGHVDGKFPTSGTAFYTWVWGIGGSPAVVDGKVYFSAVHGKVYCVDAATMTPAAPHPPALWVTDLKHPDPAHRQPVSNPNADCWSGPLVVNGRVYIGCGEGEQEDTYGFIYCLDAQTGDVIWLFCTAKFENRLAPGSENVPNVIPASVAVSNPLPAWATAAGFSIRNDPEETRSTGCAVWSSCAYDRTLNRIYVGTGNSQYGPGFSGTDLPDKWYGSGLISLDATTGEFRGFFQPEPDDSYWPDDTDIDVPGSPSIFTRDGTRVLGFGSKNGSYFLLDPDTLAPLARRQLLPREGGSGVPGDRGTAIPAVVPTGGSGENSYGVFGTAAVHRASGKLFVGVGGYNGMAIDSGAPGTDPTRTPFVRALDWETLADAWHTVVGADGVARYDVATPPLYQTREVGLSSPAVVNDVVFVSTDKVGLYALDAATGLCLWSASGLPATVWGTSTRYFALGPAIYGNYVVVGAGDHVYRYTLGRDLIRLTAPDLVYETIRWPWPPEPDPRTRETIIEAVAQALKQVLR